MRRLRIFQIDAFANEIFRGNPAAVCPLENWLDDATLQAIAQENNLAETAYFVPAEDGFHIRWFTPKCEVNLCGHATLASAFVIFTELDTQRRSVQFDSRSGRLRVNMDANLLVMDFPALKLKPCLNPPETLIEGLGRRPQELFSAEMDDNYFAVYETEDDVRAIKPQFNLLEQLHPFGVVATAPGKHADCASRYFAPGYGIPEDPVTGSIHAALAPLWAKRLNKSQIHAHQVSPRGGELFCEDKGDRVNIAGYAVKYLEGMIYV
jgi:PhzF family phenazine biosynthesis protein